MRTIKTVVDLLVTGLAVVAAVALLFGLTWLGTTRRTNRDTLRVAWPRRMFRWYRALWSRALANLAAWPHIVEAALGTGRTPVATTPAEAIWQEDRVRLYRFAGAEIGAIPVLIVHSFISKPWILDLTEGRSMVVALRDAGFDVYLLDWGEFGHDQAAHGLSHYADVLMRAEREVVKVSGGRLHLVGYCLGGTLCLARAAARRHDDIASIALIATPVDFAVPSPLQRIMSHGWFKPAYLLDASSCIPAPLVRESFHMLRLQALRTVLALLERRRDSEFRRVYGALSRWIWEHRALPGALFFDLVDLFRTNSLFEGRLEVAGEIARLRDVRVPVGVFVADRDHIVPSGSSHALASVDGVDPEVFTCPSGHVSMICGSGAREVFWPQLIRWLSREEDAKPA